MALNAYQLEKYASILNESIQGEYLSKATMVDESSFSFSLSRSGRLVLVLENPDPRVYVSSTPIEVTSIQHPLASFFRKEFSHALIEGVTSVKDDRILLIHLQIVDELFQKAKRTLVLELIPRRANLLVLDENNRILIAKRYGSLTDERPILRNLQYVPPEKKGDLSSLSKEFDYDSYRSSCLEKEKALREKRKSMKFKTLLQEAKNKSKASVRKIQAIEKDIQEAEKHLDDGQYGTLIYTYLEQIDPHSGKFELDGFEIALDPRKSAIENAECFFARAKKAKQTIIKAQENLLKAQEEKERYETLLDMVLASDEAQLEQLEKEYALDRPNEAAKKSPLAQSSSLPYAISYQGVTYLFGKNAVQNDYLSFLYATKKDRLWFHVKDRHGAHLILQKDQPTNEEILHACEFALLASHLDQGEVQYTEHKNVRRGASKGQAILKTYQSAYIRAIPNEIKDAFDKATKLSLKRKGLD